MHMHMLHMHEKICYERITCIVFVKIIYEHTIVVTQGGVGRFITLTNGGKLFKHLKPHKLDSSLLFSHTLWLCVQQSLFSFDPNPGNSGLMFNF